MLLAIRARDGVVLWPRPVPSYSGPAVAQAAEDGFALVLGSAYAGQASAPNAARATAQVVDGRTGRLIASGHPGGYYADGWQTWSARLGHPVVAAAGNIPSGAAFILTPEHGYPAGTAGNSQLILAALADNVAYIISSQCASQSVPLRASRHVTVAGVDIRSGRTLWSRQLPPAIQCGIVPPLVPYDDGFAIMTVDKHVLRYR